jgi:hypothetical protein
MTIDEQLRKLLTPTEHAMLLLALGRATAAFDEDGDVVLATQSVMLMNKVNEGNPNYIPYNGLADLKARVKRKFGM